MVVCCCVICLVVFFFFLLIFFLLFFFILFLFLLLFWFGGLCFKFEFAHPAKGTACTTHVHKCDAEYRKTSNLTPHQRWILRKRKCSLKRLKYEYKTNVLPYVYASCGRWNTQPLLRFVRLYSFFCAHDTLARPNITLSDNPTLEFI